MPPAETYTAEAHFGDVKRSVTQHKSLNDDNSSLLVFGKGDGGGGPTVEHIEKLRRARGISDTVGILPRVKLGHTVDDFFARLEKKASESNPFVTWYGELYFELHRGTYTTQSNNKKNNRQAEIFMRDIEFLATLASFQGKDYKYPKKDIDELWELICLCHFHDCLPGSSIEMVYRESDEYYKEVFERGEKLIEDASDALGFGMKKSEVRQELFAVNTSPWPRVEVVKVPEGTTLDAQWNSQQGKYVVLGLESKLGFGISLPINAKASEAISKGMCHSPEQGAIPNYYAAYKVSDDVYALENDNLKAQIEGGLITSLYDKKAGREVIPKGKKGNQLVIFDDK
jgi:alpha-mannosidase